MLAHQVADRTIGARALNRLRANESFAELLDLQRCDVLGRKSGVETTELEDAIDYVRRLDQM
jgi:hypothetical protein